MNILVTGGAGFIGSNLIDELVINNKVICVDKLNYGMSNINHLLNNENFKFFGIDVTDYDALNEIFLNHQIDMVYHLAANSDIKQGVFGSEIDFKDTFLTTKVLLDVMKNNNVKNLFFSSTSAVYGDKKEVLNELTPDLRPVSYYGGAKLASEAFISSFTAMCDMNVVIFRFPNVIGKRLTHGVIFDFINKLKNDPKKLEILGNGLQCKPYIYVSDLVDAIIKLTKNIKPGIDIYNISVIGNGTTVNEIADIVVDEMKLENVKYEYTGSDRGWKGDVPKFSYDITKVLKTGWKPNYNSNEAVRKTVKDVLGE
jgi:UDP-glucose 4-epimerase